MTKLAAKLQTKIHAGKDRGATAVEYGLMVALIAVVIIGAVTLLGGALDTKFSDVGTQIQNAGTS
jgi:pilus assembly protein Flp/PilA